MKKNLLVALLAILLVPLSVVNADIIGWSCADDGDHAIVMGTPTWTEGSDDYTLTMDCTQNWSPGHLLGDFTTDTELDPKVLIDETVENDTTFAWTDYHITIGMTKTFSFLSVIAPEDWTYDTTPVVAGTIPNGGGPGWVGTVNYYVGTGSPIAIGDDGEFGLKVSFTGSVAFATQQVPTPEPATLALLSIGALVLRRRK
ncbi:MAG: PEP-CTERM sorting domain-containing protein [Sedimentisphaerales bacterium]